MDGELLALMSETYGAAVRYCKDHGLADPPSFGPWLEANTFETREEAARHGKVDAATGIEFAKYTEHDRQLGEAMIAKLKRSL